MVTSQTQKTTQRTNVYVFMRIYSIHFHEIVVSLVCVPARQDFLQSDKLKDVAYDIPKIGPKP